MGSSVPRSLTFGYLHDYQMPVSSRLTRPDLYTDTLEAITWSETAGFSGTWVPQHHVAEGAASNIMLAAIAAQTKTLRLGAAIGLAPLTTRCDLLRRRPSWKFARTAASKWPWPWGYHRKEYTAFGVDFHKRGERFAEFLKNSGIFRIATPEQEISKFTGICERYPIDHFMMMVPVGIPAQIFVEYAQVFADDVIPFFREFRTM